MFPCIRALTIVATTTVPQPRFSLHVGLVLDAKSSIQIVLACQVTSVAHVIKYCVERKVMGSAPRVLHYNVGEQTSFL
jgi:hypothetical protein